MQIINGSCNSHKFNALSAQHPALPFKDAYMDSRLQQLEHWLRETLSSLLETPDLNS